MPLANAYVHPKQADLPEPVYPLHVRVCPACFLVQVDDTMPPGSIFTDYAYFSSYSDSWVKHAQTYAEKVIAKLSLNEISFVMEVASNDGYLLQHFAEKNISILGIDPAVAASKAARERKIPTETLFFGSDTAMQLRHRYGEADLIVANNVLAHVSEINDFVSGFTTLMAHNGVASFEFPHLIHLLELVQFDTIYHEHFSYLSLHSTEICLVRHGLRVFDVEELPTHGGSLRLWTCHSSDTRPEGEGLAVVRQKERDFGITTPGVYEGFSAKVDIICDALLEFLSDAKTGMRSVAAYGAAAKGNTLLNYCGVTTEHIDFVVDANPHKQGTLLPGSHIPVYAPSALAEAKPDYIIILPWNIEAEITAAGEFVKDWGGRFVVAVPHLRILP